MCFTPGPELAEPVPGSIAEAARRRCGIASEAPREAPAAAQDASRAHMVSGAVGWSWA